ATMRGLPRPATSPPRRSSGDPAMPPRRFLAAPLVLLLGVCTLPGAPPLISGFTPRGAERGKAVELTVTGSNLTPGARLVLPFAAHQELLSDAKPNPAQARFRLTVDPIVPTGTYPVRVVTDDGISAPLLFDVDALPGVREVEDNSTFE